MKKNYVWSVLLLSFCMCGSLLVSCGDDDDDVLTEVSGPGNGNNGNQDSGEEGNGNDDGDDGKDDDGNGGTTDLNGHKAVDLGLSVKWAACNVGASSPEEYGGYYAWGETEEKSNHNWNTYKYCNGSSSTLTKYCTKSSYGTIDNKTVLDPGDDVAHVKWGGSWRMPTSAEIRELMNNCTRQWTMQNGVNGILVTGKNGNSIFLPAAGYRWDEDVYYRGSYGYYWSASLDEGSSYGADILRFGSGGWSWLWDSRNYGFSVRPVTE